MEVALGLMPQDLSDRWKVNIGSGNGLVHQATNQYINQCVAIIGHNKQNLVKFESKYDNFL